MKNETRSSVHRMFQSAEFQITFFLYCLLVGIYFFISNCTSRMTRGAYFPSKWWGMNVQRSFFSICRKCFTTVHCYELAVAFPGDWQRRSTKKVCNRAARGLYFVSFWIFYVAGCGTVRYCMFTFGTKLTRGWVTFEFIGIPYRYNLPIVQQLLQPAFMKRTHTQAYY